MNQKNFLFIAIICLNLMQVSSQTTIPIPDRREFLEYLYSRQHQIEAKLYDLALEGKIKAYRTNALDSVYHIAILKLRGSGYKMDSSDIDTNIWLATVGKKTYWVQRSGPNIKPKKIEIKNSNIIPFSHKDISGIRFLVDVAHNPLELDIRNHLSGMALLFEPSFRGHKGVLPMPLFWMRISDMKKSLDKDEMEFLLLLYFYAQNSNYISTFWDVDDPYHDAYRYINQDRRMYISPDSSLFLRIGSMLLHSYFYIPELLYPIDLPESVFDPKEHLIKGQKNIIFDEQQHKYINIIELRRTYSDTSIYPAGTYGEKDTTFYTPFFLQSVDAITFDNASKKLTRYNIDRWHFNSHNDRNVRFYINVSLNKHLPSIQPIIWFYEDYIRWKKL